MSKDEIIFKVAEDKLPRIQATGEMEFKFDKANPTQTDLINLMNDLMGVLIDHGAYLTIKGKK